MVNVLLRVQVHALRFPVDGHDGQTDVDGAVQLALEDLEGAGLQAQVSWGASGHRAVPGHVGFHPCVSVCRPAHLTPPGSGEERSPVRDPFLTSPTWGRGMVVKWGCDP